MAISTLAAASSSSPTATHQYNYDVFISFRGKDTRNGFISHLYDALCRNHINTFIDKSIPKGGGVWDELVEAIRNSKLFLVIFSENYASSTWCLRELVEIMECKKKNENNNVIVIPVFYKIEPTHVRYQTGSYSTAFGEHERSSDGCHVQQWRTALTEAANVEGFHCVQHRDDEAKLISEIVNAILPHSVNIKYYMDGRNIPFICNRNYTHLESLLMRRNLDEVLVIGIWGMGGIGKSTIAETLFNKYSSKYEGSCFLTNSRELGTPCLNNICNVLLSQLLNQDLHITNIGVLDSRIVSKLRQKRVFVVMDDVVDSSIATDLVPFLRTHLSSGSIVLLTTRDRSVLTSGGVQQIHQIQKMCRGDSHKLVSHYAFSASHPKGGYDELTDQVIDYTDGIPLALKILGSFLLDKSTSEWDSALKKLRKYPNKKIQLVLRLSYDGLDDEEKNILLDIAYFFWGFKIDFVTEMLNSCEISANIGIKNLLDKALISTTQDDYIKMHGLIQTMCRQIVHEEASRCGGQQTRIWDTEELCNILENKRRIQKVESIILDMNQVSVEQRIIILNALRKMPKLRLLEIVDKIMQPQLGKTDNLILLSEHFKLPDKLRYLSWGNNPCSSLSLHCWPQKLVKLSMQQNKIQRLWDGTQNLPCLESIDLTGCDHLIECPNVDGSPNLKYIRLDSCTSLPDLHPSIFSLSKIEALNVEFCKALKRLCSDYCSPSLRRLYAFDCSNLEEFSVPIVPHHGSKIVLYLSFTALNEVSPAILNLKNVGDFGFNISYSLQKLPSNFATLIELNDPEKREDDTCIVLSRILPTPAFLSLKRLYFVKCKSLSKLPDNIDVLQSLQVLWVALCPIISLPERIKNLRQLIELYIFDCVKLQYLPPLPSSVEIFQTLNCESLNKISSITCKLPVRKQGVTFGIFNCMNLDKHAYEAVLKDLKSRMRLGVMDEYSNDGKDGTVCYWIPCKRNMPIDCCPDYFSYETSQVIVEVPPNHHWIFSGLVFYLQFSQYQSCFLDFKYLTFRCECYLKTSCDEWEPIASSCNQEFIGAHIIDRVLPLEMKSDHMALWYDAECCNTIKKAIKERKSGTACNPILKFVFYAQTEDNVELVIHGRGIRWMHLDFVKDKGKSSQDEMEFVERPDLCGPVMLQRWSKPPSRWMKMNVKSSQNYRGGCGGVLRDDHGLWLRGFTAPIVITDNNKILGELIAIKMGLELAWSMQVPRLICESDCHEALELCNNFESEKMILHNNPDSSTALSVLYDIYELLQRQWIVQLFRLRTNENSDANDMAAKAAKDEALGVFVWDLPPPHLSHLLKRSSCTDIPEGQTKNLDRRGTEDKEWRRVAAGML